MRVDIFTSRYAALGLALAALAACAPSRPDAPEPPVPGASQPETLDPNPGTDLYGDSLPPGAVARMGSINDKQGAGHIRVAVFSPDGKTVASAGDRIIRIWQVDSGKEIQRIEGHKTRIWSIAYSPDGKKLASSSCDMTTRIWEVASGQELFRIAEGAFAVAFSPDGKTLTTAGFFDNTIGHWDIESRTKRLEMKGHKYYIWSIAFSRDGKRLVSGSWDKTVRLWEVSTGLELLSIKTSEDRVNVAAIPSDEDYLTSDFKGRVYVVAISPGGEYVASSSSDQPARLWETATGKEMFKLGEFKSIARSLAFSPDGRTLAAGGDQEVRFYEVPSGRELHRTRSLDGSVLSVTYSPDGQKLATGLANSTILIWDVATLLKDRK
jgi:WD40 repeat protein